MSNNEEILFYFTKFKCCYMYVLIPEGTFMQFRLLESSSKRKSIGTPLMKQSLMPST
jgi:hypothetical protein